MATVVINAYSIPYPLITNDIRVDISTQASPLAIIDSQTEPAPHPERIWSFPGLPRTNYVFQMNEVDGDGNPVRQLAYFDIVPGDLTMGIWRAEEQVRVDETIGLVSGNTSFTFDGTDGAPDWTGWEISIEEYSGVGTMIRGVDYSWDSVTGVFAYLNGMELAPEQWFTVEFEAQAGGAASVPTFTDFSMRIITTDETLVPDDFGKKLIIEPAGNYLELTLPSLSLVPSGRYCMIESESDQSFKCIKFILDGTDVLKFLHGSLYMMLNEKLYIYRFVDTGRDEWRICNEIGSFIHCGEIVSDDLSNVFNKVLMDGGTGDGLDKFQYARLYNEVVLRLPVSQRVNYDSWAANQTFYSLANSANPSFADKFRIPNRLGLVEKANPIGRIVGSFEPANIPLPAHSHKMFTNEDATPGTADAVSQVTRAAGLGGNPSYRMQRSDAVASIGLTSTEGAALGDATINNYSALKYILV